MNSRMSTVYQQSRTGEIYGSISTLTVIGRRDLTTFYKKTLTSLLLVGRLDLNYCLGDAF